MRFPGFRPAAAGQLAGGPHVRGPLSVAAVAAAMVSVMLVTTWSVWGSYADVEAHAGRDRRVRELTASIVHLDEVLTMSARMCAAAGDPAWEQRYLKHVDPLDAAIKEVRGLSDGPAARRAAADTDAANLALVDMETRAFDLVRAGDAGAARRLLASDGYERQKAAYADGMRRSLAELTAAADREAVELRDRRAALLVGGLALAAALLLAAGVLVARLARREAEARKLALVASRTDNAVIITDRGGRIEWVNEGFVRVTGYTLAEVVGRKPGSFLQGPDTDPATVAMIRAKLAAGEGFRAEILNYSKAGRRYWLALEVQPVRDPTGAIRHFMAIESDVTARREAEEALRRAHAALQDTEARSRLIVETALDAVVGMDAAGRVTLWNAQAERTFGYPAAEAVGRSLQDLIIPERLRDGHAGGVRQFLVTGEGPVLNKRVEVPAVDRDGREFPVELTASPLRLADGTWMFGAFIRDISDRRRAEAELRESRERFELCVRGSNDGMWDWDVAAGTVYYSPRWMEQLGYAGGEWPADLTTMDALMHPDDKDRAWAAVRDAHDGRSAVYSAEFRMRHRDGGWRWILSRGVTVMDADGRPARMAGCHTDITDQRLAAEAVRRAEEKYRSIFENAVMGIFQTSPAGRYLSANPAMARVYGYDSVDDLLASVSDIRRQVYVDPDRRPEFVRLMAGHGRVENFESEICRKDGSRVWISENARAVRSADGSLTHYEGTIQDITQRKAAEVALLAAKANAERAREEAVAASRAKSQFLANMSHEIRTPLNGVIGMAELLARRGGLTEQQLRYTHVIRSSADSLLALINDVLDFSKIEAGKLELSPVDFDLREAVEGVAEMLAPKAAAKGLEFACHVQPDVAAAVHGDPDRLRQVLVNLANNAIKFTDRGEVLIRVAADPAAAAGVQGAVGLRFAVSDTGVGIPPDRLDRLFKSFSQVDASTTRKYGGTGLGLAIAKQLVELMGGRVGIESAVGVGSTFWFTVRLGVAKGGGEAAVAHALRPAAATLRGLRALAVDDHAAAREMLRDQLATWGFEVDAAADGIDALAKLRAAAAAGRPYRIGVVDLLMPNLDGLGVAAAAKADPNLAGTALVMLTSMDSPLDAGELRRRGFSACLTKPIRQSQLFDAVVGAVVEATGPGGTAANGLAAAGTGPAKPAGPAGGADGRPLAGVRVLLAEDNEVNQEVARELLVEAGCSVEVVANGALALAACGAGDGRRFDVVLMDCQMPEMDGFEAARRIREREQQSGAPRQPVIALTANAIEGDRQRCLAAGMDGYVTKPVDPEALVAAIRSMLPGRGGAADGPAPAVPAVPAAPGAGGAPVRATTAADGGPAPIDPAALLRRCGGKASLAERLLGKFEQQLAGQLESLRQSLAAHDQQALTRLAHTIKGAAANLSADPLRDVAGELEQLGRAAAYDAAAGCLDRVAAEARRCSAYVPRAVAELSRPRLGLLSPVPGGEG